ncbi:hypothetical protein B0H13DRAFT_1902456 [Mycena leptocephala]|nr:hypothetical protein B0H13DRAFT_1902456 [Mycena leptocephala]
MVTPQRTQGSWRTPGAGAGQRKARFAIFATTTRDSRTWRLCVALEQFRTFCYLRLRRTGQWPTAGAQGKRVGLNGVKVSPYFLPPPSDKPMVLQQRKSKGISVGARATVRRNANVLLSALTNNTNVVELHSRILKDLEDPSKIQLTFLSERHRHLCASVDTLSGNFTVIRIDTESFPLSFCMVSPWMKNGTSIKYLSGMGSHERQTTVDRLIREIAQGLALLHDQHVVHGDQRGSNILVDDDGHACLIDFGLTVLSDEIISQTNHGTGTVMFQVVGGMRPGRPARDVIPTIFGISWSSAGLTIPRTARLFWELCWSSITMDGQAVDRLIQFRVGTEVKLGRRPKNRVDANSVPGADEFGVTLVPPNSMKTA